GKGKEYGAITVHLYRPFYAEEFLKVLPKTVKRLAVLDRTKEAGALGEPLYLDICAALKNSGVEIFGGRYGLGGKEFTPQMAAAVFKNLESPTPKAPFTVGVTDDISFTSLTVEPEEETPENQLCCKFFGYGSDGTVGAVKRTAQLVGDNTERFTQAFFCYDSKKSGGYTVSHLRVSPLPIRSPYRIGLADFIACTRTDFLKRIRFSKGLKKGGVLLINTPHTESEQIFAELPSEELQAIEEKQAAVYAINAHSLAEAHGLKGKISTALQAAFFALHPDLEQQTNAFALLENSVKTAFAKKGEETVEKNLAILKAAKSALIKIELTPRTEHKETAYETGNDFWTRVAKPVLNGLGDELPVSAFCADGSIPTDTAKHEKRGITFQVPRWNETACIQCNTCAFSCPHATIRPYLIKEGEKRPEGFRSAAAKQADGYRFHMQVYPLDCTGCGVCQNVCPANRKEYANAKKENREVRREALALTVDETLAYREEEEQNRRFAATLPPVNEEITQKMPLLKRSQFLPQLFEFSGACAGCGETPYIKALTSLFGERLIIANATGCSSIYGGTFPVCPYAKNAEGRGAAWANSLFEDNAEFGCGIRLAYDQRRAKMHAALNEYFDSLEQNERAVYLSWLENQKEVRAANALAEFLQSKNAESLLAYRDCFTEKSVWCVGGDGWAYDIGFSGVDHIMASGLNIKLLVLDSEVYSNTGGQQSKATPKGAAVKFAESGKKTAKKPLAKMMTHYENVYVAQCSIGADGAQFLKALKEADEHDGPALLVCYAPCISHGYDMGKSMEHARLAAQSGYFPLFRYFNGEMHEDSKSNETLLDEFYQSELRFLTKKQ
ncbi:MAG: pyruvate:ferredoxin (flavodoxin) oxidoreductase, partial [Clostridia bacterium]|nr:pyruvate:ferredoxin (flavodoxin) oxidoreductase [Clostridia bacterium]